MLHPDIPTGSTYAAEADLDQDAVTCGDPWVVRVRAVNEMGQGPPEWYPTLVRTPTDATVDSCRRRRY